MFGYYLVVSEIFCNFVASFRGVIKAGSGDPMQFAACISNTMKNIYKDGKK
jgi:hypothetical protein